MANTKPPVKTDYLHIRISPSIKEGARLLASSEGRSMSDLVSDALRFYVKFREYKRSEAAS